MAIISEEGTTTTKPTVAPAPAPVPMVGGIRPQDTSPISSISTKTSTPTRVTPTAPGPSCPAGYRLCKVSTTSGIKYVYAPEGATSEEVQLLAGASGMVTTVMSPAAYEGGVYPYSREVETVDGQKVVVPYSPTTEAKQEYVRLYGPIPATNAPQAAKDFYQSVRSGIESQMATGAYVSPLSKPIPVVQEIADRSGLTYSQALMEAKTIANRALTVCHTPGSCGPLGMTGDEARIASDYFSSIGRTQEADTVKAYYVSLATSPEGQLSRAENVDLYGVFADLAPFRSGVSYDLPRACASGVCNENNLKTMGFSPDVIAGAMAAGSALKALWNSKFFNPETGETDLSSAMAAGNLTEPQARLLFGDEQVDSVVTMGFGGVPEIGPSTTQPRGLLQRAWEFLTPWDEAGGQSFGEYMTRPGTLLGDIGYMVEKGTPFALKEYPQPDYPKLVYGYGPAIVPGGGLAGGILTSIGSKLPNVAGTGLRIAGKLGLGGGAVSTAWAGIEGALTPEKGETWEQAQKRMYSEYLISPELAASVEAGKARGEDLRAPTYEEYKEALGVKYEPLSYREGIVGVFGRGWEKQSDLLTDIAGDTPWYHPRSLISGFAGYVLSPALAAQAQPYVGPKAALIAIPHFGPTAIQPFIIPGTPIWQKVAGIGFAALPYATGPMGAAFSRVGQATSKVPILGTLQRGIGGIVKGVGWIGEQTGISPLLATVERGMPWQFAYTLSEGAGRIPFPMRMPGGAMAGKVQMVPLEARAGGLGTKGTKFGWWDREVTPLKTVWGEWYKRFSTPKPEFYENPVTGERMTHIQTPEGGRWINEAEWYKYASKGEIPPTLRSAELPLEGAEIPPKPTKLSATQTRLVKEGAQWVWDNRSNSWQLRTPTGYITKSSGAWEIEKLGPDNIPSPFEASYMIAPKPTSEQVGLLRSGKKYGATWGRNTYTGEWGVQLPAESGAVIVPEGGTGSLVIRPVSEVTSVELASRYSPSEGYTFRTAEPAAIVQEAPTSMFQRLFGQEKPAFFLTQLGEAGWYNPAWTKLNIALPALTVGAMSILAPMTMAAQPIMATVDMDLQTLQSMLEQGKITQSQYNQVVNQMQQAQLQELTQQQVQEQVQQVVQETLTQQQQEQYQQQQQQQQQQSLLEQLQQEQQQEWEEQYQAPQEEFQTPWQQPYQFEPGPFEDEIRPPKTQPPEIIPPMPWLWPGAGGGVSSSGVGGGMHRALAGGQWIMPGLILTMPDPFGYKPKKIRLTKRTAKRYGAKEPRLAIGGLRI